MVEKINLNFLSLIIFKLIKDKAFSKFSINFF